MAEQGAAIGEFASCWNCGDILTLQLHKSMARYHIGDGSLKLREFV